MKTLWCLAFIAIAFVDGKAVTLNVPQDLISNILKSFEDCVAKHGIEEDILPKIMNWTVEDTEPFRKFLFCFSTSAGFMDDEGHLIIDNMMKLIDNNYKKKDEFQNNIVECNKIKGSDKYETVFKTASCFYETSPVLFKL